MIKQTVDNDQSNDQSNNKTNDELEDQSRKRKTMIKQTTDNNQ